MNDPHLTPDPIDQLLKQSVSNLDRSPGLPSNFAHRMAMLAAEKAAANAAKRRRREHLMSWFIPVVAAIAAIVAIVFTLPTLPSFIVDSVKEGAQASANHSNISLWGLIAASVSLLVLIDSLLRRRLARRSYRR